MCKKRLLLFSVLLVLIGCQKRIGGDIEFARNSWDFKFYRWLEAKDGYVFDNRTLTPLSGKITCHDQPLPFANLEFYNSRRVFGNFINPDFSTTTNLKGDFQINLPQGHSYYVIARKSAVKPGRKSFFAFYGDNPLTITAVGGKHLDITTVAVDDAPPEIERQLPPGVYGKVLFKGKPLAGVRVYLYEDSLNAFKKYYTAVTRPTGEDGHFYLSLPEGEYFFVARKRVRSGRLGPMMPGDFYGFYHGNPLAIFPSTVQPIEINLIKIPDYFHKNSKRSDYSAQISKERRSLYPDEEPVNFREELRSRTGFKGKLFSSDNKLIKRGSILLLPSVQFAENSIIAQAHIAKDGLFSFEHILPGVYYLFYREVNGTVTKIILENSQPLLIIRYGHTDEDYTLFIRP